MPSRWKLDMRDRRGAPAPRRLYGEALKFDNTEAVYIQVGHEIGRPRCLHSKHVGRFVDRNAPDGSPWVCWLATAVEIFPAFGFSHLRLLREGPFGPLSAVPPRLP